MRRRWRLARSDGVRAAAELAAMQHIDSLDDPRVAVYRNLRDRTLRGENIFVAEGPIVAQRLLESRYQTESVLVAVQRAEQFATIVGDRAPVYVADEQLLRQIVGFPFHLGVLAAGRRKPLPSVEELLSDMLSAHQQAPAAQSDLAAIGAAASVRLIVCPEITKPENLGLVCRSAAALGIDAVLLGAQCCDPLSRRALRVSMGATMHVPLARSANLPADLTALKTRCGFQLIAATTAPDAEKLPQFRWPARAALLVGNEFTGLSQQCLRLCDQRVTIPMQPTVDSLNLGVAAAICMYAMTTAGKS